MFTPTQLEGRFLFVLRWSARILGSFCIGVLLFFIFSAGPNLLYFGWEDLGIILLLVLGFLSGLILAWSDEAKGGALAASSVVIFYFVLGFPLERSFRLAAWTLLFSLPGFLFLLYGAASSLSRKKASKEVEGHEPATNIHANNSGAPRIKPMTLSR